MQPKSFFILLAVIALGLFVMSRVPAGAPGPARAVHFYETYAAPLRDDDYFLLNMIQHHDASFYTPGIRSLMAGKDIAASPFIRLFSGAFEAHADDYMLSGGVTLPAEWSDDTLIQALYCDLDNYTDADYRKLTGFRDNQGGYGDTHVLFGLLLLRHQGCGPASERDALIPSIAHTVAENETGPFNDLFAERVVSLYWAGYGSLVQEDWVRTIAKNQQSQGGWADAAYTPEINAHTTGLAVLALIYWGEGKEAQDFFYPLSQ
jgi:hypothetical protein